LFEKDLEMKVQAAAAAMTQGQNKRKAVSQVGQIIYYLTQPNPDPGVGP
jgi:hypothetical protein